MRLWNMKKIFLYFALFIAGIYGCDTGVETQEDIYGSWNWIRTTGGFAGVSLTPQSEGYTMKAVFSRGNSASFYKNDSLIWTSKFTVNKEKTIFSEEEMSVIHYESTRLPQAISIKGDTLTLSDNAYDGFNMSYVKIK